MNIHQNKIALITGGGKRLGRKLALAFAERKYDVIVHYNTSQKGAEDVVKTIENNGQRAIALQADLSNVNEIKIFCEEVSNWTSELHVLVNNSGIFPTRSFEQVDEQLWDETLHTNLKSIFFLTQALLPLLKNTTGAAVVNIASLGAYQPWNNHIPYCVSKAGVVMLTRALAKSLAPNIRVNAIAPGIIYLPDEEERTHLSAERIPLKRYGTAKDYVDTVLFLAETSQYITGQIIPLDGGTLAASV